MKRILPTWCKEVKKSMIDDDINVTELAERVGFSRNYVYHSLCCGMYYLLRRLSLMII